MFQSRFRQADREACIALALYAGFFVWWTVGAFGLGDFAMTPVFGMPAWFFVSCVLGYPVACVALWLVVRRFFADVPLHAEADAPDDATPSASGTPATPASTSPTPTEPRS